MAASSCSVNSAGPMALEDLVNTVLTGDYRVDSQIAKGGMGVVLAGTHVPSGDRVAIKVLTIPEDAPLGIRDRFLNEALAVAKLKNAHVARFRDVGTLADGTPYMVMELLEGVDLSRVLEKTDRLLPDIAVDYILQACEALSEAHSLGIVHRDIKPSNLFVATRTDGTQMVKVLDFGISRAPLGLSRLTSHDTILGTPVYMAPEQMKSARLADARSDIWSLGAVLYELIEGLVPFDGDSYAELCLRIAMDPPMSMIAPVQPGLERAIAKCLAKDPTARWQHVGQLGRAIVPYARNVQQGWLRVVRIERHIEANPGATLIRAEPEPPRGIATLRMARARVTTPGMRKGSP